MVWPAIIAAGAALAGSALSGASDRKDRNAQLDIANMNVDLQKEFAQQGIRWKVADAKAAGLHPLAALGTNTTSFSPVSVYGGGGSDMGSTLAGMGQNVADAIARQSTDDERKLQGYKLEQERLRMEQIDLQNQGLRRELNTLNTTPAFPPLNEVPGQPGVNTHGLAGQGDLSYNPGYVNEPNKVPTSSAVGRSAGTRPATDPYAYPHQDPPVADYPNDQLSESLESGSFVDRWKHTALQAQQAWRNLKNYALPKDQESQQWREWLRQNRPAEDPGYIALWDGWNQVWRRVKSYPGDTRLFYDVAPSRQYYGIER